MDAWSALRLADLVEESLGVDRDEPDEAGPEGTKAPVELRDVSAELSALLVELARTPEQDVDVAKGWTPGLAPGDEVGRFVLKREIGRGGFGVVYEAFDRELGRPVAFKALRPGRRIAAYNAEWLRGEAEAVAKLNHPNIVTLHDFGRGPSGPYLIFELLRGETLADRLRGGRLPFREAVAVGTDVARVLAHAHKAGVVHRDLKPANVFLCEDGAVKVLDFGLAHLFGRAGAVSGGTPSYMAPEQWRNEPGDERSDLFSLGVLLYQMVTGRVPYRVTRERSEAQEPGPPPELPRDAAPSALRKLSAELLQKDSAERPAAARDVVDALVEVQRRLDGRGGRRRLVWTALLAGVAVAIGAALLDARRELPGDGEKLVVAVADFENGTGERELDGLSGLLVTSLEQSRRFQVLTRSRLLALFRQAGKPDAPRIDAVLARDLARAAGAKVLLAGSARRDPDGGYTLELRALDPSAGRKLFSVSEVAPAKAEVFPALDRLSVAARLELREDSEDVRKRQIRVAQAITSSTEAYQAYFDGVDCVERPSRGGSWMISLHCADHFRAALAHDPAFALAHYRLAILLESERGPRPDLDAHMAAAVRYADRVPPKEARLIRAWEAHVGGRDDEALRLYGEVLADYPDDAQAVTLSGEFEFHKDEWAASVPFFEKALAVNPNAELPLEHLVDALAVLRRNDDLARLFARLEAEPASGARTHAMIRVLAWRGEVEAAIRLARRAVETGSGPAAVHDLAVALSAAGSYAEVEAVARARLAEAPGDAESLLRLATALRAQGRRREGMRVVEELAGQPRSPHGPQLRALYLAGDGDASAVWREAAKASAITPANNGLFAVLVAFAGDVRHAGELAKDLPIGSTAREEYEALLAWREGDAVRAAAKLAPLELRDPWPALALPPAYLLAEVASDAGDAREAAAAAARFRALLPRGLWRGWAYPRSLYLSAVAHESLGEREAAREHVGRLLALWSNADEGEPLLEQARALRAKLER
jgi:tetratricopeptide (TPR) repeat protein/TolB-like protein